MILQQDTICSTINFDDITDISIDNFEEPRFRLTICSLHEYPLFRFTRVEGDSCDFTIRRPSHVNCAAPFISDCDVDIIGLWGVFCIS